MWYLDKEMYSMEEKKKIFVSYVHYDTMLSSLMEKLILANSSDEVYLTVMKKNGDKWL